MKSRRCSSNTQIVGHPLQVPTAEHNHVRLRTSGFCCSPASSRLDSFLTLGDPHRGGPATQPEAGRRQPGPHRSRGWNKGGSNRRCGHRLGSCSSRTGCQRASLWNIVRCFAAGNLFVCGILCSEPCGTKSSERDPGTPGSRPSPEVNGESHDRKQGGSPLWAKAWSGGKGPAPCAGRCPAPS